jgi:hypothetical protein
VKGFSFSISRFSFVTAVVQQQHISPVLFPQPTPLDSTTLSGRPIIRGSLPSLVCRGCRPSICCPSPWVTYCWASSCFCTTAANISQNNATDGQNRMTMFCKTVTRQYRFCALLSPWGCKTHLQTCTCAKLAYKLALAQNLPTNLYLRKTRLQTCTCAKTPTN